MDSGVSSDSSCHLYCNSLYIIFLVLTAMLYNAKKLRKKKSIYISYKF